MKKIILSLSLLMSMPCFAADEKGLANLYFSSSIPKLTLEERQSLDLTKRDKPCKPFPSADGAVSFVYGLSQINIICAPLQVCDIALQPGEHFNDMNVGDPRFIVEPSITGAGMDQQIHLIIKPKDVGLDSSLVVTTDRRTYHFRLKSTRFEFMPYVSFIYPDEAKAKWHLIEQMQAEQLKANTIPETQEYLGNLDFNYQIQGNASFKPVRVYNDGVKTIIEMPKAMSESEAPALLVIRNRGCFQKSESVMVNYRLQDCRYIVDGVFDKAVMIIGSGPNQEKITITRC